MSLLQVKSVVADAQTAAKVNTSCLRVLQMQKGGFEHSDHEFLPCWQFLSVSLPAHALLSLKPASVLQEWKHSSFKQRKLLLKAILKYTVEHQQAICR